MQFSKPPLPVNDQLLLLQSRGLIIPDTAKAQKYLSNISYYRLSAYSIAFQNPASASHEFKAGVAFDDVLNLYLFDRELRIILFDAIERTEISFRTQLVNQFSINHHAHWFEDSALFANNYHYTKNLQKLDEELARSGEVFIKHYRNKYTLPARPPAWMSFEVASMGLLSKFYRDLKMCQAKKDIAAHYGLPHPKILESWLLSMSYVRNICAHHARLWNRTLILKPTLPRNTKYVWLQDTTVLPAKL
ncbi:MAG: Abi family protein [Bacteroidia bacterium]|jgi:abortive infection bacteriophage resistance protein|nr:Abi family protein [Bacteroidia bacterium]